MLKEHKNTLNPPLQIEDRHSLECLSANGCFSLHNTNVRMSGNHKLVYKSQSQLFLESISSDDYLSRSMFKAYAIDKSQGYRHNLFMFFQQSTHNDSIWTIKKEETAKGEQFTQQYPDLYKWGAYSETNDLIGKRFRFFAPLWTYGTLPDRFLLFRVKNNSYTTIREYLEKGELIMSVDMKETSIFGSYLRTLTDDVNFKDYCIQTNYEDSFIRYHGIDIESGKFKYNTESDLDSYLANERTITEFNNALTNGWMRGKLLCPNILNLEFAFDDHTVSEGFNNYIGFYCMDNEIAKEEADILQKESGTLIINSTNEKEVVYKPDTLGNLIPLPSYSEIIKTTTATQLNKIELNPIAEIILPFAPVPSSVLTIDYLGNTEVEIYMLGDILNASTTTEALEIIAQQINQTTTQNIIITASVVDSKLVIKSQLTDVEYENIVIKLPPVFQMSEPKYYQDLDENKSHAELYNSMRMITMQDLLISTNEIPDGIDFVEVDGENYLLEQFFTYRTGNVIRLDETFASVKNIKSEVIKFKQQQSSKFHIMSFVKHVNFDLSMMESPYYDIYDFDMLTYQQAFGKQMHEVFERYSRNEQTKLDLEIIDAYISYFQIDASTPIMDLFTLSDDGVATPVPQKHLESMPTKEVLVKDFDTLTLFPSTTCKNEFDRLSERTLVEIRNVNILEPMITKFSACYGYDSYNNPIMLNIGLPWRNDNFLSTGYENRSLVNNTHMWFILGSGPGPIQKTKDGTLVYTPYLNDIKKQLGYVNIPLGNEDRYHSITLNLLDSKYDPTNIDSDVYDLLTYKVNDNPNQKEYRNQSAWTYMYRVEGETNRYSAIFRGVEWSFIGNYEGYRFSVIMVTEPNVDKNKTYISPFNLVDNQVFKTLTLIINYYIPDKLITSLNGQVPYYIDRSFFYYSTKFYMPSAIDSLDDLDSAENISMNLFETSLKKNDSDMSGEHRYKKGDPAQIKFDLLRYRDSQSSPKEQIINTWYTTDENGSPIFYVSLNQLVTSGHGQSFKELIQKNENTSDVLKFEWLYLSELSDTTISIMIRYTAYDIVEVEDNFFWCKDIFMEFVVNDIYLEEYDDKGNPKHIMLSIDEILENNQPTIKVNGVTYQIPFWEKISSSQFMNLPITDSKGIRRGLRLTKEFYEEVDPRYIYPENIQKFFRTEGDKTFLVFDTVQHYGDSPEIIEYRCPLENKEGTLLEKDQYWYMAQGIAKNNALFLNFGNRTVTYDTLTAGYVRKLLEMYPIKTFIVTNEDFIETSKNIEMLLPSETYIVISLGYDAEENKLKRLDSRITFKISRLTGYYGPLFKKILQPNSITIANYIQVLGSWSKLSTLPLYKRHIGQLVFFKDTRTLWKFEVGVLDTNLVEVSELEQHVYVVSTIQEISSITARYVGQLFYVTTEQVLYSFRNGITDADLEPQTSLDIEYIDCVFPEKLIPQYTGRKICTNDQIDNYCEEFYDGMMRNPYDTYFYTARYDGIRRGVIADAALSEHRGFISNTYYNTETIEIKAKWSSELNLIDVTRDKLGPNILSKYLYYTNNLVMQDMIYALKLYNPELNESNIIYEDFYKLFYERFYIEWFCKHYKVQEVKTDLNYKIDFYYSDFQKIGLKTSHVYGNPISDIIITFVKC